jgi:type IV pilus biogenesis/stability protein PilW
MKKSNRRPEKKASKSRPTPQSAGNAKQEKDLSWIAVIFLIAFAARVVYLLQIQSIPLFYNLAGDGRTYDEWAQRIAAGDWLGKDVFYQAPLYPYFLGLVQLFFGHDLWLIRIVQVVLGSITSVVVFVIGKKLFSRNAGIAAGLILACYAPAIFFDGLIEKSVLDLVLLTALLYLLLGLNKTTHWSKWLGAGAVLGLLGLCRENALILVPVVALWTWLEFSGQPFSSRARWLGLFFAGLLLILVPVGLRNLTVGGEFKLTTSQFGPNFFIGNNATADGTYGSVRNVIRETQLEGLDAKRLAERAAGRELKPGEVSSYWFNQSLDYIKSRPTHWLRLLGLKWLLVWNSREIEDSDDFYIYQRWSWLLALLGRINHFGILAPIAALGVVLTWRQWRRLWLLYAMILSLAASVALFYVFGRYRFPLVPLLVLFAGAAVCEVAKLYKDREWSSLLPGLAALLLAGTVVNLPVQGDYGPGAAGHNNLANAYLKQGKIDDAIQTASHAIEIEPTYGVAHYNLGNLYAQQGKFELARRHFEEALRLYPNYADVHSNYGQLLAERGDIESGIEHFRKAIELNPALSRAHLNLGVALVKQGRLNEAISPLQQAVRLTPESAEASYYLGSVYAALNRYADAAESFKRSLQIQSDFVPAHQSLAQLLASQGKREEATQHYQEALRIMKQRRNVPVSR